MLENILEYQAAELELVGLENELAKSKDRERAAEIQQNLKNQHARLIQLENIAMKVNESYAKASAKFDEYMKKLDALEAEIKNALPDKAEQLSKVYKEYAAVAVSLEKDVQTLYANVNQVSREYEEIIRKSKTDREKFDKFKASYAKLKADVEPKMADVKTKLAALAKKVDPKILGLYKQKREGHIFPVFVELSSNKCGGCRMEISASKLGQMKTNQYGIIECENCGRFIFNK